MLQDRRRSISRPVVEVLYFEGCPNHRRALELVERTSRELGIETELQLIAVRDQEAAQELRFLGSPFGNVLRSLAQ